MTQQLKAKGKSLPPPYEDDNDDEDEHLTSASSGLSDRDEEVVSDNEEVGVGEDAEVDDGHGEADIGDGVGDDNEVQLVDSADEDAAGESSSTGS